MRITIKTKLAGAFGVIIALAMAAGRLAYIKLDEMTRTQAVLVDWTGRLDKLGQIRSNLNASIRAEKNAILLSDPTEIAKRSAAAVEGRERAGQLVAEMAETAIPEAKKRWQEFTPVLAEFAAVQKEVLTNAALNSGARAAEIWSKETLPLNTVIANLVNPIIAELSRDDANPAQVRAALALQTVRLDWLRMTRATGATDPLGSAVLPPPQWGA